MIKTLCNVITKFDNPEEFKNILLTKKIGIWNFGKGIGDNVHWSYWPEIFYKNTGKKLVDLNNYWCYDYNPYIERNQKVDVAFCPWDLEELMPQKTYLSAPEQMFTWLKFKINLRHPRLYRFEDSEKIPNSICIHTNGRSMKNELPDKIIDLIASKYKNYMIYQIGGKSDKNTPFIDKRGLGMWETAELISKCQMFIGINSGMMHVADCYPSVWKKILVFERTEDELVNWWPCSWEKYPKDSHWLNTTMTYYNLTDDDIGITYSWKKI